MKRKPICPECGGEVDIVESGSEFSSVETMPLRVFEGRRWHDVAYSKVAWACKDCGREINAVETHWHRNDLREECMKLLKRNHRKNGEFVFYKKRLNELIDQQNLAYKLRLNTLDVAIELAMQRVYEEAKKWG